MPERFLVFIPAYNCEKQVPRVLNQLLDGQVAAMVTECIVVNNRSTDGTEAAVQSWMQAHPQAPPQGPGRTKKPPICRWPCTKRWNPLRASRCCRLLASSTALAL